MRLHATIPALYPHGRRVKGVARIRHVGCAHPGDTLTLARIRSSRHRCAHPSKRSNKPLRTSRVRVGACGWRCMRVLCNCSVSPSVYALGANRGYMMVGIPVCNCLTG